MLSDETRRSVRDYLLTEGERFVRDNLGGPDRTELLPFHARLMPIPFPFWSQLSERSFSTRSGSWFQQVALRVARQYHKHAEVGYHVTGRLAPAAEAHITALIAEMERGRPRRLPSRIDDINAVQMVQTTAGVDVDYISDLFVERQDQTELYFEMKTPKPNKDTSKAMKRGILLISALRKGHPVQAFGSAAYNPYGDGAAYTWNYARQFMEIERDFLVGRSFWSAIGEPSTYDELLPIASEVGEELIPLIRALRPDATPPAD